MEMLRPKILVAAFAGIIGTTGLPWAAGAESLTVVHIAAECWPFARTGGLGEAVAGLATSQARNGASVTVVMPLYRAIRESATVLRPIRGSVRVTAGSTATEVQLFAGPLQPGTPRMIFIDHKESFDRDGIYGEDGRDYADNGRRFALLSATAIAALPIVAPSASVVHAHDWHAAPALALIRNPATIHHSPVLRVLSVHNAAFQGHFDPECIAGLGLCGSTASAADFEWYGRANYLKGGLASADLTLTVSPNHAISLFTPAVHLYLQLHNRLEPVRCRGQQTVLEDVRTKALEFRRMLADEDRPVIARASEPVRSRTNDVAFLYPPHDLVSAEALVADAGARSDAPLEVGKRRKASWRATGPPTADAENI